MSGQTFSRTWYGKSYTFSVTKVIDLMENVKSKKTNVLELSKILSERLWEDNRGYMISPFMVIQNPSKYPEHWSRIQKADLRYAILVNSTGDDVFDGLHRLSKAFVNRKENIKTKIVTRDILQKALIRNK